MPQYKTENYDSNQTLLELIRSLAHEKNATPAQISLAWILCKKPYIIPIPGSRKLERIKENGESADIILTSEEVRKIDESLERLPQPEVFDGSTIKR